MVVADKKAVNLTMPVELLAQYDAITSDLGRKEKWMVVSAAMLMLLEAPPEVRDYYINQAGSADLAGGSFDELIERAKTGGLRVEANARAAAGPKRKYRVGQEQRADEGNGSADSTKPNPRQGPSANTPQRKHTPR